MSQPLLFWVNLEYGLQKKGNWGLINHFVKDSQVIILASYKGLRDEEIGLVEKGPLYAAAFDYI